MSYIGKYGISIEMFKDREGLYTIEDLYVVRKFLMDAAAQLSSYLAEKEREVVERNEDYAEDFRDPEAEIAEAEPYDDQDLKCEDLVGKQNGNT